MSPMMVMQETATSSSRWDRLRGPMATAAAVGALTLALHLRDPHAAGSWGGCPWLALTGKYCPGCGGLRAINDLTNGDLVAAASSNLVLVAVVPLLALWWLTWTGRAFSGRPRPGPSRHPRVWMAFGAVVMVVFVILRNLPSGAWLAP